MANAADLLQAIIAFCESNNLAYELCKKLECEQWFADVEVEEYCPVWDEIRIMPGRISKLTQEHPGKIDKLYIGVSDFTPRNSINTIKKFLDKK